MSPFAEEFFSKQKGRILDLGCGSGRNFIKVNGLRWTAIDFSEKMVGFAKVKAKKLGMDVDVWKADSTKLPFDDNSFDNVLCFAVIHCIDSTAKRKKTLKKKIRKYQIKTFVFDMLKTKKPEDIDEKVNEFLKTVNVKDEEQITIDQGDAYIRVSIIYKLKVDKV